MVSYCASFWTYLWALVLDYNKTMRKNFVHSLWSLFFNHSWYTWLTKRIIITYMMIMHDSWRVCCIFIKLYTYCITNVKPHPCQQSVCLNLSSKIFIVHRTLFKWTWAIVSYRSCGISWKLLVATSIILHLDMNDS